MGTRKQPKTGDASLAGKPCLAPHTEIILDSIADGVFTVDLEWRIMSFNRAAEEITGISASEAIGRPCCEVLSGKCL